MADWFYVSLQWTEGPPTDAQLVELNRQMGELDLDFPPISLFGIKRQLWRNPVVSIHEIVDYLHMLGHPCVGKLTSERAYEHEHATWVLSKAREHNSFAALLPHKRTRFEHLKDEDE